MNHLLFGLILIVSSGAACAAPVSDGQIRSDYAPGEITRLCAEAMARHKSRLDAVAAVAPGERKLANTLLRIEEARGDFYEAVVPLIHIGKVHTVPAVREESVACEQKFSAFLIEMGLRKDLYAAVKDLTATDEEEKHLLEEELRDAKTSGLNLPDDQLAEVKALVTKSSELSIRFGQNLNEDKSFVAFTAAELAGVPAESLEQFKRDEAGNYLVTSKGPDIELVSQNATNGETRRRLSLMSGNKGGAENPALMEETLLLRQRIAAKLGFATFADKQMVDRMAKTSANVLAFLDNLRDKLATANRADLAKLLSFKRELEPGATKLEPWDVSYLAYQLRKQKYGIDDEQVRAYFPATTVVKGMFEVYSRMLGIRIDEVPNAPVWAPEVKFYAIHDAESGALIAHFYTDFFPRPGKYGHAAAATLRSGRLLPDGSYRTPISMIMANFKAPTATKPSLLSHAELRTVFHEFGHVMHQTLTRARFSTFAGSSVARDFVEAPSQMLENWIYNPKILDSLSGHYLHPEQKLPAELRAKLLAARDLTQGMDYTYQLFIGLFDMNVHTAQGPIDVATTWERLSREVRGIEPTPGTRGFATFDHLMRGYSAGYYGYLWSKVYAQDMFSVFEEKDLASPVAGRRYRKFILEPGGSREAADLVRDFLGREPNEKAFFRLLKLE